jgi:hypothetical protein
MPPTTPEQLAHKQLGDQDGIFLLSKKGNIRGNKINASNFSNLYL